MFNAGFVLGAVVKKQSVNFDLPLSDSVRGKSTVDGLTVAVVQCGTVVVLTTQFNFHDIINKKLTPARGFLPIHTGNAHEAS